jgi:hypothetical protein
MTMLTSFLKDDAMLATELMYQITMPIPASVATLIVGEVGRPSFRSSLVTAWYVRAEWSSMQVPFALRCDFNGNWNVMVSMTRAADLHHCLDHIVPMMIEIIELPRGRANRAA